jgi:RsmE family RNA methyltransferase
VLAIGPEGGFIDREVQTFREVGFTPVSFGPRILRVETAMAFLVGRIL